MVDDTEHQIALALIRSDIYRPLSSSTRKFGFGFIGRFGFGVRWDLSGIA
jgi:hypothetical protein